MPGGSVYLVPVGYVTFCHAMEETLAFRDIERTEKERCRDTADAYTKSVDYMYLPNDHLIYMADHLIWGQIAPVAQKVLGPEEHDMHQAWMLATKAIVEEMTGLDIPDGESDEHSEGN
jgi:hypothetical protein